MRIDLARAVLYLFNMCRILGSKVLAQASGFKIQGYMYGLLVAATWLILRAIRRKIHTLVGLLGPSTAEGPSAVPRRISLSLADPQRT